MNTKQNDRLYREIMKSIKARQELAKLSLPEQDRIENDRKIRDLLDQARILTNRL